MEKSRKFKKLKKNFKIFNKKNKTIYKNGKD